ncbi:tripartite tricarboxylate transporter TctB family protein [Roseomonas marmotae]|uniref:Tripartite tricarboxylate transporter TctB family protein n=1 Tax=Roseomonas marmotae TaxID=2768161 RepID=A0ABS3K9W0_9PROT|nr:tripartite tricarboxylate transporter TctB family protein [Roseomonas marmotae]MBO1074227.1 tripartite tricarboxylate transporter TctB family protein [Roseomonas marmotae]QTI78992.1 tripartite tricarboxylate transporter TctB family protein [Roseomonas marmotae]
MQFSDRITGSCLVALGAVTVYGASLQPGVPGQDVGPSVFPTIIGCGLMLCGALVVLGIGHSFEAPEETVPAETAAEPVPPRPAFAEWRAFLPPLLLVFYVLASETLGFLLTAMAITVVTALALGARLRLALFMAVLTPVLIHLAFVKLLRVPLPEGLLAMPW